jgi:hypothetical protein
MKKMVKKNRTADPEWAFWQGIALEQQALMHAKCNT